MKSISNLILHLMHDTISSIHLYNGARVRLYQHTGYKGSSRYITKHKYMDDPLIRTIKSHPLGFYSGDDEGYIRFWGLGEVEIKVENYLPTIVGQTLHLPAQEQLQSRPMPSEPLPPRSHRAPIENINPVETKRKIINELRDLFKKRKRKRKK